MATFGNVNIARNEITGKFIKTDPPNRQYLDNYDKVFAKKTVHEWNEYVDAKLELDEAEADAPAISYKEFLVIIEDTDK
tara:strand:+ start:573 stop:809 length:237 start_codon:yes stop_codon:yes gene_type:complete